MCEEKHPSDSRGISLCRIRLAPQITLIRNISIAANAVFLINVIGAFPKVIHDAFARLETCLKLVSRSDSFSLGSIESFVKAIKQRVRESSLESHATKMLETSNLDNNSVKLPEDLKSSVKEKVMRFNNHKIHKGSKKRKRVEVTRWPGVTQDGLSAIYLSNNCFGQRGHKFYKRNSNDTAIEYYQNMHPSQLIGNVFNDAHQLTNVKKSLLPSFQLGSIHGVSFRMFVCNGDEEIKSLLARTYDNNKKREDSINYPLVSSGDVIIRSDARGAEAVAYLSQCRLVEHKYDSALGKETILHAKSTIDMKWLALPDAALLGLCFSIEHNGHYVCAITCSYDDAIRSQKDIAVSEKSLDSIANLDKFTDYPFYQRSTIEGIIHRLI